MIITRKIPIQIMRTTFDWNINRSILWISYEYIFILNKRIMKSKFFILKYHIHNIITIKFDLIPKYP